MVDILRIGQALGGGPARDSQYASSRAERLGRSRQRAGGSFPRGGRAVAPAGARRSAHRLEGERSQAPAQAAACVNDIPGVIERRRGDLLAGGAVVSDRCRGAGRRAARGQDTVSAPHFRRQPSLRSGGAKAGLSQLRANAQQLRSLGEGWVHPDPDRGRQAVARRGRDGSATRRVAFFASRAGHLPCRGPGHEGRRRARRGRQSLLRTRPHPQCRPHRPNGGAWAADTARRDVLVSAAGKVRSVEVKGRTRSEILGPCLETAVHNWTFEVNRQDYRVQFPLVLRNPQSSP